MKSTPTWYALQRGVSRSISYLYSTHICVVLSIQIKDFFNFLKKFFNFIKDFLIKRRSVLPTPNGNTSNLSNHQKKGCGYIIPPFSGFCNHFI
nr:MAG TPA: hypothetical protein [Caudoviricetes sp.]